MAKCAHCPLRVGPKRGVWAETGEAYHTHVTPTDTEKAQYFAANVQPHRATPAMKGAK